ncbi:MAG TPA: carboxypeptidase regulatory-like domain-containing protein [Longimicrobium sp.]|nr:carboxypeptidase regulatory-like domain-containing protein [Longimicrobium sp.]
MAITALAALFGTAGPAAAQGTASITGRVLSPAGEPVADATVEARPAGGGALRRARSGAAGEFRITGMGGGTYTVRASRLGYQPVTREVAVGAGEAARIELRLTEEALVLAPVEVRSPRETRRERTRFETEAGVTTRVISGQEIKALPGLGEADVLRAVEVLPGVVSTSDFTSAFNVRGGSADQNLILLDGFTIFNPFHLGGLFSVFNADVIARAELLAGGFGAEYGGRVSSVLSVETEAAGGELSAETGVSLLASRIALRSSLPAGVARTVGGRDGSWMLSARRSYFDAVLRPVTDFPYHLTDVQLGAAVETGGGGRLQLTGYIGEDVLDLSDFDPPTVEDGEESILRLRWNWGNDVAGARWTQPLGRWVADTRLGFSRYAEALSFPDFSDTRFTSRIQEGSLRSDFVRQLGAKVSVKTGGELVWMENRNLGQAGGTVFFAGRRDGLFGAAYLQARWQPSAAWIVEPGVRADVAGTRAGGCAAPDPLPGSPLEVGAPLPLVVSGGSSCVIFSPRLAIKRFLGPARDAAVKLAAGRYVQWLHSVRDEQLPISNDTWVIADEYVPPVVSDQVQLGLEKYWGDAWYASAEAYYRTYEGVTDFNLADDTNDPADDLLIGRGHSYGLDLLVRRSTGRLTGWTTVSLLRARRTFPDPMAFGLEGVPQTVTFSPVFDRRVDVDLVVQYALPARLEFGARWNYGTGTPYTRPVAQYVGFETDIAGGAYRVPRPVTDDPDVPVYIVPGDRNRERYPVYHRLDLTLRRPYTRRWGTFTPYLQVLNVYNQKNVLFYFYNYDSTPPTRSGITMFPLLPAFGVEASF